MLDRHDAVGTTEPQRDERDACAERLLRVLYLVPVALEPGAVVVLCEDAAPLVVPADRVWTLGTIGGQDLVDALGELDVPDGYAAAVLIFGRDIAVTAIGLRSCPAPADA